MPTVVPVPARPARDILYVERRPTADVVIERTLCLPCVVAREYPIMSCLICQPPLCVPLFVAGEVLRRWRNPSSAVESPPARPLSVDA